VAAPGPLFTLTAPGGVAPFYAVQFDKDGVARSPLTNAHMVQAVRDGDFTDVFVFSHGWNNDWNTALGRYRAFIQEFQDIREEHHLELGRDYRPLLCGVFWPSTALVMPWEQGPDLAGLDEPADEPGFREAVDALVGSVAPEDRPRFYELVETPQLTQPQGTELVGLLTSVFRAGDDEIDAPDSVGRTSDDVVAAWATLEAAQHPAPAIPEDPFGFGTPAAGPDADAPAGAGGGLGAPDAAGFLDKLNPRNLIRGLTVYQMKDRAGVVGSSGVGPLLRDLLTADEAARKASPPGRAEARFHLVGHSYGARVLLNAASRPAGGALPRAVDSMLLLQPAVNHLCFSARLPDPPHAAGGNRAALEAVRLPILTTYSEHDVPLHDTFHLALRRGKDLGEAEVAAAGEPPSKYAALGGYGPRGEQVDWRSIPTKLPTDEPVTDDDFYDLGPGAPRIWALDGRLSIHGHGDVVTPTTAWALVSLVRGS
jgi:hypothetical protein